MISVILTYYRKRQFIKKCLQSIISQTYKNYEVILVYDDDDKEDLKYIKKHSKLIDVSEWQLQAAFSEKGHRFRARCYLYQKN